MQKYYIYFFLPMFNKNLIPDEKNICFLFNDCFHLTQ